MVDVKYDGMREVSAQHCTTHIHLLAMPATFCEWKCIENLPCRDVLENFAICSCCKKSLPFCSH